MGPAEIQFHVFLTGFSLHSENKFFHSSVAEFYLFSTQALSPISLNLPSFRLHNPSSSQYFLPSHVFSTSSFCSGLPLQLTWRDVSKPVLHFHMRPPQCRAEPRDYCMFPMGSRKPELGADMAVPLPVPELCLWLGYLWLLPCCREGKIPSAFWKSFHWYERRRDLGPVLSKSYDWYP